MIMQKAPWNDQKKKKIIKRWWEYLKIVSDLYTKPEGIRTYQNLSKLALRGFSIAVTAIIIKEISMMYPVQPGPETKLACSHPTNPRLFFIASWAKLFQWAIV